MRKRLYPGWILALLTLGLLLFSACTAQTLTPTPSPTPTETDSAAEPTDQGQLQFIEFYSPF